MNNFISENFAHIRQQIQQAEKTYQRLQGSVKLLAVSKQQSIEKIKEAFEAGQVCFGENYLQEALIKIAALKKFPIEWHFIGHVQSNKTALVAKNFSWVHSVDRLKIAERLNAQRPDNLSPLNICLAVNIDAESKKSGVMGEQLFELARGIIPLKNLRLRGLMAIPKPTSIFSEQLKTYERIAALQKNLCAIGFGLDTLSMGMSEDFVAAIAAGSTIVRVGTGIFGAR